MVYCMILSAVCIALGLLCLLRPALVWKWTEQWKSYRADEPSELYRFGIRFGGALFLVFGVVLPFLPLLLNERGPARNTRMRTIKSVPPAARC